ncbi:MAG: cytochrome P460 family protein [Spirochaetota bacterium]
MKRANSPRTFGADRRITPAPATPRARSLAAGVSIFALLLVLLAGCEQELAEPDVPALTADEVSPDRLWDRITEEAPYTSYAQWPGESGVQPGQAPHGPFHRILVNKVLLDAVPVSGAIAPHGSIIVKENLNAGQELTGYTVMAKVDGYAPEDGDWYWARYLPDGTVAAAGAVESCIVCHAGMIANDYVIVHPLDEPLRRDE